MPYKTIQDLPERIKNKLPEHAQEIYCATFNHAWSEYEDPDKRRYVESRDVVSHKVAWAAVKKKYKKNTMTGKWHKCD